MKGFTLIELIMAIAVLSITVVMFSKGLHRLTEQATQPIIKLQASWIAQSYLDEIVAGIGHRLKWCDPHQYRRRTELATNRQMYESVCDYVSARPKSVLTAEGQQLDFLRDYKIKIDLKRLSKSEIEQLGFIDAVAIGETENIEGMKFIAQVLHPTSEPVMIESYLWASK